MLEITHQKAQALLQAAADSSLSPADQSALDAHLLQCKACSDYAGQLASLEIGLRSVLHARWDQRRPNLNVLAIIHPAPAKLLWHNLLNQPNTMGRVSILAVLLLGYILVVTLVRNPIPISKHETPTILPIPNEPALVVSSPPTPSPATHLTSTGLLPQSCYIVPYTVQATDSLASIAMGHGSTKELIMEYNHLNTDTISPGMELLIPLCKSTPSHTARVPGNSLTITPVNGTFFPGQTE